MSSGVEQHPDIEEGRTPPVEAMPTEKKAPEDEEKDEKKPEEPPKKSHPGKGGRSSAGS